MEFGHTKEFWEKHNKLLEKREKEREERLRIKEEKKLSNYLLKLKKKRNIYKKAKAENAIEYQSYLENQKKYREKYKKQKQDALEEKMKYCQKVFSEDGKILYYVDVKGNLFSKTGKKICGKPCSNGYILMPNGKLLHRVIWETFNGKIPEGMEIDHINCIRDDNRLENLRLVTHKENCNNPKTLENYSMGNTTGHCKPLIQTYPDGTEKEWISASEAGRNGYSQVCISKCCKGKLKSHKGCYWKFKNISS